MFDDAGRKLKGIAKIVCWAGIVLFAVLGILMIVSGSEAHSDAAVIEGAVLIAAGAIVSYLTGLGVYALGQLVENSDIRTQIAVKEHQEKNKENQRAAAQQAESQPAAAPAPAAGPAAPKPSQAKTNHFGETCEATPLEDGREMCPLCGTVQNSGRKVCWECGATFQRDS